MSRSQRNEERQHLLAVNNGIVDTIDTATHPFAVCGQGTREGVFLFFVSVLAVIGLAGQQISLPIFLSSGEETGGPYFVLWLCSFSFTVMFAYFCSTLEQSPMK